MMKSLQVQCRKLNHFNYEMEFIVPGHEVQRAFDQSYRQIQQKISVPGFRKGRVPLDYVRKNHQSEAGQRALRALVENMYIQGLQQHQLNPAGSPQFDLKSIQEGQEFHFTARLEVHPQLDIKNFENLTIQVKKNTVTEKNVMDVIENLRDSSAKQVPVEDRACQKGDVVHFDLSGELEGGKTLPSQKEVVEIGSTSMFKEMETALTGLKIGEQAQAETRFPKEHFQFPNKKVRLNIKLNKIFKKIKPELNDQWAKTLYADTVEKLKQSVEQRLTMQLEQDYQNELREKVLQELIDKNPFEVSPSAVTAQKKILTADFQHRLKKQGVSEDAMQKLIEKQSDNLNQRSLYHVKAGYIIHALSKKLNIREDIQKTRSLLQKNGVKTVDASVVESVHFQRIQERVLDTVVQKSKIQNIS